MTGGSPKVNAAMLPEELRQIIPIAETCSSEHRSVVGDRPAPTRRCSAEFMDRTRHSQGCEQLDGPVPDQVTFSGVVDELARPDPGQTIPRDCREDWADVKLRF